LLAVRGSDAATVQRVGGSVRREVRGLGDDPSHGLSPRSRGALLGFGDALKIFAARDRRAHQASAATCPVCEQSQPRRCVNREQCARIAGAK